MKRTLALAMLLAALPLAAAAQGRRGARKHPVETFFKSGVASFNTHDLDGFMRQFSEDVEMYTPTGWLRGRAPVHGLPSRALAFYESRSRPT